MAQYDFSNVDLSKYGAIEDPTHSSHTDASDENSHQYNFDNVDLSQYGAVEHQPKSPEDFGDATVKTDPKKLKEKSPGLYKLSEYISQRPALAKTVSGLSRALAPAGRASSYVTEPVEAARLPELGEGLLQSASDITKSVGDIPFQLTGSKYRLPNFHFEEAARKDPISQAAFQAARMGGQGIGMMGGMGALEEAARVSPKALSLSRGIAGTIGRGAAVGAIAGEQDPYGRVGGAVAGGLVGALEGITPSGAIKILSKEKSFQGKLHKEAYDKIFAEAKGVDYAPSEEKVNRGLLMKLRGNKSFLSAHDETNILKPGIKTYTSDPSFETAHQLQSDFGQVIRNAQITKSRTGSLSSVERAGLEHAIKVRNSLKNSIESSFRNAGRGDLANAYKETSKSYRDNYLPYIHPSLRQASMPKGQYGRISSSNALKDLRADAVSSEALHFKHPKIMSRLFPHAGIAIGTSSATLGALELAKILGIKKQTNSPYQGNQ